MRHQPEAIFENPNRAKVSYAIRGNQTNNIGGKNHTFSVSLQIYVFFILPLNFTEILRNITMLFCIIMTISCRTMIN